MIRNRTQYAPSCYTISLLNTNFDGVCGGSICLYYCTTLESKYIQRKYTGMNSNKQLVQSMINESMSFMVLYFDFAISHIIV